MKKLKIFGLIAIMGVIGLCGCSKSDNGALQKQLEELQKQNEEMMNKLEEMGQKTEVEVMETPEATMPPVHTDTPLPTPTEVSLIKLTEEPTPSATPVPTAAPEQPTSTPTAVPKPTSTPKTAITPTPKLDETSKEVVGEIINIRGLNTSGFGYQVSVVDDYVNVSISEPYNEIQFSLANAVDLEPYSKLVINLTSNSELGIKLVDSKAKENSFGSLIPFTTVYTGKGAIKRSVEIDLTKFSDYDISRIGFVSIESNTTFCIENVAFIGTENSVVSITPKPTATLKPTKVPIPTSKPTASKKDKAEENLEILKTHIIEAGTYNVEDGTSKVIHYIGDMIATISYDSAQDTFIFTNMLDNGEWINVQQIKWGKELYENTIVYSMYINDSTSSNIISQANFNGANYNGEELNFELVQTSSDTIWNEEFVGATNNQLRLMMVIFDMYVLPIYDLNLSDIGFENFNLTVDDI